MNSLLALGLLFFLAPAFASPVITHLQDHLQYDYLPEVQALLGDCGAEDCLVREEDHLELQTPDRNLCFPWTQCGYYDCMERQRPCESVGIKYFSQLAAPTCRSYTHNINNNQFSANGIEWIYEVMVCLQKGLFEECEIRGACDQTNLRETCEYIEDYTLKFHPGCYLESGVGVCQLALNDQRMIWKTVGPYLTAREWVEAFKVVMSCLRPWST